MNEGIHTRMDEVMRVIPFYCFLFLSITACVIDLSADECEKITTNTCECQQAMGGNKKCSSKLFNPPCPCRKQPISDSFHIENTAENEQQTKEKEKLWSEDAGAIKDTDAFDSKHVSPETNHSSDNNKFVKLTAGAFHTCGILKNRKVKCWGINFDGQLGNGNIEKQPKPTQVLKLDNVKDVSAGKFHTCALRYDGTVWCWGNNRGGQLGSSSLPRSYEPVKVQGLPSIEKLSAGYDHNCVISKEQKVICWGDVFVWESFGRKKEDMKLPLPVKHMSQVRAIASGYTYTCGLLNNGTVKCWGKNEDDELLLGVDEGAVTPLLVKGVTNAIQIAVANFSLNYQPNWDKRMHTCIIRKDKTVWCWGCNWNKQLGDGTHDRRESLVQAKNIKDAKQVIVGNESTCVLLHNGTIKCWGKNENGVLGTGSKEKDIALPTLVKGITSSQQITTGHNHNCSLQRDGTAKCWGNNRYGQLGNGSFRSSTQPTDVQNE